MTINLLWQFILIAMYIQQGSLMYIASTVPNVGLTTEQNTGLSRAISKRYITIILKLFFKEFFFFFKEWIYFKHRDGRAYYSDYNDSGRRGDDHDQDMPMDQDQDNDDMKEESRVDYWNGYYDFLINEGSYKFWAVFQVLWNISFLVISKLKYKFCW